MLLKEPQSRFEEYYRIYRESFPSKERRTREEQRDILNHPCHRVRIVEEEGEMAAFVGYWELPGCLFLEHLATAERCRGKGYGKKLVEECLAEADGPVFLEIEPVTESDPMTARRAGFYERLGFYVNTFPYLQLPLKEGDRPVPLWVMSYGKPVTEEEFEPYKKEIYEIAYGVEALCHVRQEDTERETEK